ncbi:hypothetical protein [Tanticharoenia sakaeratensis]|uniref:Lipoprotein n=1 Tax=Tanticharoenia sakaeratensis NBRC 103193 TaxID=1231623 RepID=A0A0D6MPL1_9PROT|nr:hypothetical protein [Tanticharoenia sakaeratensis]GAN55366.1 hypothetical protein Tasa_047_011 [Tanticharoenia sakaeratensis NBRC 103193]GBQ16586.1 hypothetical protein AA103193_0038 [Tanticharoenia sakaeratensis NBRC 103193]
MTRSIFKTILAASIGGLLAITLSACDGPDDGPYDNSDPQNTTHHHNGMGGQGMGMGMGGGGMGGGMNGGM